MERFAIHDGPGIKILAFMDIKHMDDTVHQWLTGEPYHVILENARRVAQKATNY